MSHQDASIPGETCTFKGKFTQCILGAAVGLQQMQVLQRCSNLNAYLSIDVGICGQMNPTHEDYRCGRVAAKAHGQSLRLQTPGCIFNTTRIRGCRESCLQTDSWW